MTTATGIIPLQGCRCRRPLHVDKRVFDMNGLAGWWWWFSEKWCSEMIVLLLKWGGDIARIQPGCSVWVCRSSTSTFGFVREHTDGCSIFVDLMQWASWHCSGTHHGGDPCHLLGLTCSTSPRRNHVALEHTLLVRAFVRAEIFFKGLGGGWGANNCQHPVHVAFNGTKISKNGSHPFGQDLVESSRYIKIVTNWKCKDLVSQNKRKKNLSFYVFTDVELAVNHESNLSRVASVLLPTYLDWLISLQEPRC